MVEFTGTKKQLDPGFSTTQKIDGERQDTLRAVKPSTLSAASGRQALSAEERNERIARRAYEIYEERGREDGQELEDWLRAEQEVKGDSVG